MNSEPFSGPVLQGLWRRQFSTPDFIVQNLLNHWNSKWLSALVEGVRPTIRFWSTGRLLSSPAGSCSGATRRATIKAG